MEIDHCKIGPIVNEFEDGRSTLPQPKPGEKCVGLSWRKSNNFNKSILDRNDEELFQSTWEYCFRLAEFEDVKDQMPKLRAYYAQLHASEGFDLDENPTFGMPSGGIMKAPCCSETHPDLYNKYMDIARFVIHNYNYNNRTTFVVSKVHTVNVVANLTADIYYMTFPTAVNDSTASTKEKETIFQAKVMVFNYPEDKCGHKDIQLCRIKP